MIDGGVEQSAARIFLDFEGRADVEHVAAVRLDLLDQVAVAIAEQIRFILVGKDMAWAVSVPCYERLLLDHPSPLYEQRR